MDFPAPTLERQASLVRSGDVVFFIGAGFSIDSESNSSGRLIRRLLLRLLAMTHPDCLDPASPWKDQGPELLRHFVRTFDLSERERGQTNFTDEEVRKLSVKYYEVNEWFCQAFDSLLLNGPLGAPDAALDQRIERLSKEEEAIRAGWRGPDGSLVETVPLRPVNRALVEWAHLQLPGRGPGKALFLDTLGFRCQSIMRGQLRTENGGFEPIDEIERQFFRTIYPRHRALARFAREGWCTTTITTNYDLLLEGAFRLTGFNGALPRDGETTPVASQPPIMRDDFPRSYFEEFARIGSPVEFFTDGKALRTPVLVKMHGCAETYRARPEIAFLPTASESKSARAYLRSMVFTYREIQNWREDSWAADFLRTQLRTRTVVFCGYSLGDPVVHDTFRTVYEEMARIRRSYRPKLDPATPTTPAGQGNGTPEHPAHRAPAFFFAPGMEKQEFYGLEVLQAASEAVGAPPAPYGTHPNYVRFNFRGKEFPNLDELLAWTNHLAIRLQQEEVLAAGLHRVASVWLGKTRPIAECNAMLNYFKTVCSAEKARAHTWGDETRSTRSRRECARLMAWTETFHTRLLREFACGEVVLRPGYAGPRLARLRRTDWHYPFTENQNWTAWAVVVELALRRIAKALGGTGLTVADCARPTVLFAPGGEHRQVALTIHFPGFGLDSRAAPLAGAVHRRVFWELRRADARWTAGPINQQADKAPFRPCGQGAWSTPVPPAGIIWRWAAGTETDDDLEAIKSWFIP